MVIAGRRPAQFILWPLWHDCSICLSYIALSASMHRLVIRTHPANWFAHFINDNCL